MNKVVHIIMGLSEDSFGIANYLQKRKKTVYIIDSKVQELDKQKEFTFVDQLFVDSLDTQQCRVYVYDAPYKQAKLQGVRKLSVSVNMLAKLDD
ncbi:hypothetical protein [Paenisporosarcina sp. TG20]|uniref:hypothetical protein n=1 Tax=Paenisporosarcina sp. TG20 TaxID=1211706 RepID=UPI0003148CED|nr:hypothetical protein [Paenisporosarcina sp. TG20]